MKNIFRFIAIGISAILIGSVLVLIGCVEQSTAPIEPTIENKTIQPQGIISGKIFDKCTGMAIEGAIISVGYGEEDNTVQSTVSDASGSFSFADVPAGSYKVIDGRSVSTGTYLLTESLVDFNKKQTDSTKRYRNYYYNQVTITFTSLVPGDSLGVSGLVGDVACSLSTLSATIKGTIVDQNIQAVPNATVMVYDHFTSIFLAQTITGSDGSFKISSLESGATFDIYAQSADGSLQGSVLVFNMPCNLQSDSLRSQVNIEQIKITPVDNVAPFVISLAPENNSDLPVSGIQIVYTFSEPIKQVSYTRVDLGLGYNTLVDDIVLTYNGLKKTQGSLPIPTFSWNTNFTTLTITPVGVVGSGKYSVNAAVAMGKLKDRAGNSLVNNTSITGDFEVLNFTTAGGTTGPAAPTLARRYVPNLYGALNYTGGTVSLLWAVDPNPNTIRSYNIYRSIGGGPFEIYRKDVYAIQDTVSTGPLYYTGSASNPYAAKTVSFKVTGVSKDLVEGTASSPVVIGDDVKPALQTVTVTAGPGANTYLYTLQFSEPLNTSNAQGMANYTIQDPDTVAFSILSADYLGYNAGTTRFHVQLLISASLPQPAGYSLIVGNGIVDLAGNQIDAATALFTFSAPPIPVLQSPNNGATGIGLLPLVSWKASNGARSYSLQVATNGGFTTGLQTFTSTVLTYNVPNLTVGTLYYWRVSATNAAGTNGYSASRTFTP